ncbi:MAG TPA: serine/threonine-protein kinase [Chitinophagaceae bacterium]|jgi:serine/threonine-protein kinase
MIGKQVQNYEIKSHLGEGGMGTVFRASDSILNRDVALKMLHTPLLQQPLFLERFKKEARVLAQLLHPNIAVIYNMIEQDNNHFMVMEYVEGKNLDALVRQYRTLSYKIVVPVIIQALEGLGHAHRKGIFHRDIKPSNLILKSDGTVKLMDFGIAMVAGEQRMTQVNRVVGTVEYIAPEIIQGKEPSIATDLYAMGITMYELLTGKLPFEGNSDYNLMQDILKKKPLDVNKLNLSVPKALSDIVMKTLEKKPGDRFADARALQNALINAFPDLRTAELTESYVSAAAQYVSSPSISLKKKVTPQATQVFEGGASSGSFGIVGKLKQKALAKENRLLVICGSVVLLTAVMAFIFMPHGSNSGKTDSSVSVQPKQEKETPKNPSGDNSNKSLTGDNSGSNPVNPQPNNPNPTPVEVPDEPKKETTKKNTEKTKQDKGEKKSDNNNSGNTGDKGEENKSDKGNNNGADKGDNNDTGDKGEENKSGDKGDQDDKNSKTKKPKTITWDELFGKKKKDQSDKNSSNKKVRFTFKKN